MLRVGVIGFGYWGPNIVRNFIGVKDVSIAKICDRSTNALRRARALYPHIFLTRDSKAVTHSPDIDIVAIVTPVATHYSLAKQALENGKHIFVEKPFTATSTQAKKLIAIAKKRKLMIMVDHTFLFTGAVKKIKEVVDKNLLGDLYYYDSTRISLGLFQSDVNVLWDLAPHDLSIIDHVINKKPRFLAAQGMDHLRSGKENIAYLTLYFDNQLLAHLNVNWLSPVKVRTTLIGGKKKMLVWDDLQPNEKIKIYDKGVEKKSKEGIYRLMVDYRSGDIWSPKVEHEEALKKELNYFIDCIKRNQRPLNDGEAGLRIVELLEAADCSIKSQGKRIKL